MIGGDLAGKSPFWNGPIKQVAVIHVMSKKVYRLGKASKIVN
jgi:hypothetical protein